jgi:hypothetical protein
MPRTSIRSWPGKALALLGLLVVVLAWPVAKVAEGLARRFPEPVLPPRLLVFLSVLVVASLELKSAIGLDVAMAVAFLLACLSSWLFALPPALDEKPVTLQEYPRTAWRLCDPELSTHGLWRAELVAGWPEITDPGDHQMLLPLIQELVHDWGFRSGWPYYQSRVLSATWSGPRTAGPFSSVADSSRVYRIRLDVGETGWIHFGDGYVEFQLELPTRTQPFLRVSPLHRLAIERLTLREASHPLERPRELEPLPAGRHPLWDRWLDG